MAPRNEDGFSAVIVSLDGKPVAQLEAYPDDALGRVYDVDLTAAAARLKPGHAHELRIEVPPGRTAHGLCVYGGPGKDMKRLIAESASNPGGAAVIPSATLAYLEWTPAVESDTVAASAQP